MGLDWRDLVLHKLDEIDKKLDCKVDKEICELKNKRISVKQWIILTIIISTIIGTGATHFIGLLINT